MPANFKSTKETFETKSQNFKSLILTDLLGGSVVVDLVTKVQLENNMDEFLDYVKKNNLTVFLPDEHFVTVFHVLIEGYSFNEFDKLVSFVRASKITEEQKQLLRDTFIYYRDKKKASLTKDQILYIYSDLKDTVVNEELIDEKYMSNIEFMSEELRKLANEILDNY